MASELKTVSVCFVSLRVYPLFVPEVGATFGGAEVDLYLLATELAQDPSFSVSMVVGDYGQPPEELREKVRLCRSVKVDGNLFLGSRHIWRTLKAADAQIVMSEACSLGTVLNAWYCRRFSRKFVYRTAHSRECDGTYLGRHPIRGRMVAWAYRQADSLLTQNASDAEGLKQLYGLNSQIIRNGCRLDETAGVPRDTILWVGRSAQIKRPDRFLRLAEAFPAEHFTMICQRQEGDTAYDTLVEEAGKIDNLTFLPNVPYHQVDNHFARAKVFVSTSDGEGFPNTFIQAARAGTPILSYSVNPDGFLDTYQCGLCADGSPEALSKKLGDLLRGDPAEQMGRNGLSYVQEHHDIKRIVEQYKRIFRELVDRT